MSIYEASLILGWLLLLALAVIGGVALAFAWIVVRDVRKLQASGTRVKAVQVSVPVWWDGERRNRRHEAERLIAEVGRAPHTVEGT